MAATVRLGLRIVVLWLGAAALGACRAPSVEPTSEVALADELFGAGPRTFAGLPLLSVRQGTSIHLMFTLDPARPSGANLVEVTLTPRDDTRPAFARTTLFNVAFKGPLVDGKPAAKVQQLLDEIVVVLERYAAGGTPPGAVTPAAGGAAAGVAAPAAPRAPAPDTGDPGAVAPRHPRLHAAVDRAMAGLGLGLVAAFLLLLPWTLRATLRDLRRALDGGAAWRAALVVGALGLVARLVLPHLPVMYYMGYPLAEQAAALRDLPKYGPGALALYHLLFWVTGTSHVAMMYANSVVGALVPLAGGALLARLRAPRLAVLAAVVLLAATPLFVHDHTTESLLVPTVLWLLLGLAGVLRYRAARGVGALFAGALHLVLAAYARPEALLLVPLTVAVLYWRGAAGPRAPRWPVAAAVALAVLLVAGRCVHLSLAMVVEQARGNTPQLWSGGYYLQLFTRDLFARNVALWPSLFPAGITLAAVLAIVLPDHRRAAIALVAVGLAWLAASMLDLPYVSVTRVEVPGVVFVTLAAALGLAALHDTLVGALAPRTARGVGLAALVVLGGTMAWTVPGLWQRTNADDEEELLRDAVAALPPEPVVFVRRTYLDPPEERLHLGYPDYWLRPPRRHDLLSGAYWFAALRHTGRPAYFLLGTRCYMRECGAERALHPACRRIVEGFRLEPVIERTVPVRRLPVDRPTRPGQELDFPWCLAQDQPLRLGLYRVLGPQPR